MVFISIINNTFYLYYPNLRYPQALKTHQILLLFTMGIPLINYLVFQNRSVVTYRYL